MTEEETSQQPAEEKRTDPEAVTILVNEQPVTLDEHRVTGLQIKEAAITAGLPIDRGFQLIEELPHGRTRVVGDGEVVQVHPGSKFLALAPDDNS